MSTSSVSARLRAKHTDGAAPLTLGEVVKAIYRDGADPAAFTLELVAGAPLASTGFSGRSDVSATPLSEGGIDVGQGPEEGVER
jgi:hypothetical protein